MSAAAPAASAALVARRRKRTSGWEISPCNGTTTVSPVPISSRACTASVNRANEKPNATNPLNLFTAANFAIARRRKRVEITSRDGDSDRDNRADRRRERYRGGDRVLLPAQTRG